MMKTKILILTIILSVAFKANAQLIPIYSANFDVNDLFCLNKDTVFACGNKGQVLKTFNGGDTWQKDSLPTEFDLQSVIVQKTGVGYVSGESGTLFKTSNFGLNWSQVTTNIRSNLNNMKFYNDSCGFACNVSGSSGEIIYKTENSGENWDVLEEIEYINSITCFGKDTLYAGTFWGLYYSYDSGINWDIYGSVVYGQSWLNDSTGFITDGEVILKTVDAGKTFSDGEYSDAFLIDAVNDTIIYGSNFGCLGRLYFYKTMDGGQTWDNNSETVSEWGFAPYKMNFVNKDTGYVLFDKIYKTTNGSIYTCKNCTTIGIMKNLNQTNITISPNPMEYNTLITLPSMGTIGHYRLYNNFGQVVEVNTISSTSFQIQRGNKIPGIYILNISDIYGNLITNQKLIIK